MDNGSHCINLNNVGTKEYLTNQNSARLSLNVTVSGRGEVFFPITIEGKSNASVKIFNEKGVNIWNKILEPGKSKFR